MYCLLPIKLVYCIYFLQNFIVFDDFLLKSLNNHNTEKLDLDQKQSLEIEAARVFKGSDKEFSFDLESKINSPYNKMWFN